MAKMWSKKEPIPSALAVSAASWAAATRGQPRLLLLRHDGGVGGVVWGGGGVNLPVRRWVYAHSHLEDAGPKHYLCPYAMSPRLV